MSNYIAEIEEAISTFNAADIEGPIHMLNLIKYREDGSAERFQEYSEKTLPLIKKVGGKIVYFGNGMATIVGAEQWDVVLIMEYPSVAAFY